MVCSDVGKRGESCPFGRCFAVGSRFALGLQLVFDGLCCEESLGPRFVPSKPLFSAENRWNSRTKGLKRSGQDVS